MDTIITQYAVDQRDPYGQYAILPGHTHVFELRVPMFGSVELTVAHILPNSQDFSIDVWISEEPLDGLVLNPGFGHHRAKRRADKFMIHDSFLKVDREDDRLFLDSHKTYYVNVKNLQNRKNAYQLDFELGGPTAP
jgi:hypothetical protein